MSKVKKFMTQLNFCVFTAWFVSDLVANLADWCPSDKAQMVSSKADIENNLRNGNEKFPFSSNI